MYLCTELPEESSLSFDFWNHRTSTVQVEEIWMILLVYLVMSFLSLHSLMQKQMFYFNWCSGLHSLKANSKVAI